jgi:hypothetical protein
MKTPEQLIRDIDRMLRQCKKQRLSRLSVEWGKWSVEMNRPLRDRMKKDDPEKERLALVFLYWQSASVLLELEYKNRVLGNKKKRQCRKDMAALKDQIYGGKEEDSEV